MPGWRYVVFKCDNEAEDEKGISIHQSPKHHALRKKWISFVEEKRHDLKPKPGDRFPVCSTHFEVDCFHRAVHIPGQTRRLKPGSFPTIYRAKA